MTKHICDHIAYLTSNLDSMRSFYVGVMDFDPVSESTLPRAIAGKVFGIDDDCRFVKLQREGFVVELFEPLSVILPERSNARVGMDHWGYCVRDRAAFVENLRRAGRTVITIERDGRATYFAVDPDKNRIEIRAVCEEAKHV